MTAVDALQSALAGEHAAIFGYEVVAARASDGLRARCLQALDTHVSARDRLRARIAAQGSTPIAAEASYVVPDSARGTEGITAFAALTEQRLGVAYAQVILEADTDARRVGLDGLRGCAVRASGWTGSVQDLPGITVPSAS